MPDDENVIETDVVRIYPDLSGFRRRLARELKTQMAGMDVEIPVKINENANREALNYVAGLRAKYIQDQLKRTRNLNEQVQRANDQARQHELKQERSFQESLDRLHRRAADNEFNRVRSLSEKLSQAREQAETADAKRTMSRVRNLEEQVGQARDQARQQDARRRMARARNLEEQVAAAELRARSLHDIDRQRKDEQFLRFQEHINSELGKIHRARAEDEISIREQTLAQQQKIERAGQNLRMTVLSAMDKVEKAETATVERESGKRKNARAREESSFRRLKNAIGKDRIIDFGGKGIRPMNLLYSSLVALSPALLAVSSNALQASTSLVALGSAGIGAALGVGGLVTAFQGIGDVLKLRQTVRNEALTQGANSAKQAVKSAASERAAQDRVTDAIEAQNDARRDEVRAYAAVHRARQEAIRDLEDLRQRVVDLNNEYRSDQLSVREAEEAERTTNRNFFATATERLRAHQDTLDARTRLSDTRLQRRQSQQDLRESIRKGIEGSEKVVTARQNAADATRRRRRASRDVARARRGEDVAAVNAVDNTTSAAAQLEDKLKRMAPAARAIYYWFDRNELKLQAIQRDVAQAVLPGFYRFLEAVSRPVRGRTTIEVFADAMGELGGLAGKYAGLLGEFSTSRFFRDNFDTIQRNNVKGFDVLGAASMKALRPLTRILAAASPLFPRMALGLSRLIDRLDAFIERANGDGSLAKWFEDAWQSGKKWMSIGGNLLTLLGNIFKLSLPSGASLVDRLQAFTKTMADWSGSPAGQRNIARFFEFFRDLPYGKIKDFFIQATALFAAKHIGVWARANPLFAAIGVLATSNPAGAVAIMSALTRMLDFTTRQIVAHPEAAATLLAILSAAKLAKAVNVGLNLPGLNKIRDLLTSKFKVLDKFIGGGATTATMTVHAGVVNVYGKAIAAGGPGGVIGGAGGSTAIIGTDPKTGKPVTVGKNGQILVGGKPTSRLPAGLRMAGGAAAGLAVGVGGNMAIDAALGRSEAGGIASGALNGALLGWTFGGPIGAITVGSIGAVYGGIEANGGTMYYRDRAAEGRVNALREAGQPIRAAELKSMQELVRTMTVNRTAVGHDDPTRANSIAALQDYINKRKASVEQLVAETKASGNAKKASETLRAENQRSIDVLSGLLQQWGWSKTAADDYARKQITVADVVDKAKTKIAEWTDKIAAAAKKARDAAVDVGTLGTRIDAVTGHKVITLSVNGQDKAFKSLESAVAYQQVLRMGVEPTEAKLKQIKNQIAKQTFATGGPVRGAGTATSDSIPAWLSHGEFVQPAATVAHYGPTFMERLRRREIPREVTGYARGGRVDRWPYRVKFPDGMADAVTPAYSGDPGGGAMYTGRTPRGLGAVAGLTARMMAAVIDAHRRFPWASVTSGRRYGRNAITVTGRKSLHGFGRATDWPASMELFNYFAEKYRTTARELIFSPAGMRQIWKGRPHMYTGKVRDTHWNHVHLALAKGGLVNAQQYDSGGVLPPGFTMAYNGTGKNETIRTHEQEKALSGPIRLDRRDIALLANALTTGVITMDGRKVAETTNRYNYLPAGV